MEAKKVCVILPVYNVKPYLERCVNSVLEQTYLNYDVILVDDGSNDGSGEVADEIAAKYKNVISFHKPNGGAGDARNYGIEKSCSGGGYYYLAFVDPDDVLEKTYLEKLVQTADNADFAICGYKTVTYNGTDVIEEKQFKNALKGNFIDFAEELCVLHNNTLLFGPWNKLFRADIIYEYSVRFGTTKRYEDTAFVYRYLQHCNSIAITTDCLYLYSKFMSGRKTAVTSFGNEYCEGAFIAYEEGQKVVAQMSRMQMNEDAVFCFKKRLDEHLQTSIIGEMIVNLSVAPLNWEQRKSYVRKMIERYHEYLPVFDDNNDNGVGRIARKMANRGNLDGIVGLSYLYRMKHRGG